MIILIVAMSAGNVIGYKGEMPWERLPEDLHRFKALTMGHHLIVGSKTLRSIKKGLPGRKTIVLTHNPRQFDSFTGQIMPIQSIDTVVGLAKNDCVFVAGGEHVYRQFVDKADLAYITRIHADFKGDTVFPELNPAEWGKVCSDNISDGGYDTCFEVWARGHRRTIVLASDFEQLSLHAENRYELISRLS